ncbi:MAG: hypothetical protein J6B87_01655 [Clostridia bacterium]|nr:hypothetical protein [Clostridia bacterium]
MRKILKIILCLILVIIIGIALVLIYPNFNKKHFLNEFNITFKVPIHYEQIESEEKNITFKSNRNGIGISIYKFEKDFLSSMGMVEKLEDYAGLLEAANYDCVLENTQSEIIEISKKVCGKYTAEIKSVKQLNKEKTIIIPKEEYDVIFSVYGVNDQMIKYEKQVEKILNSIKIK